MNEIGLSRKRGVISAVQIASAVASYARISINEYKNIPGNPCIMSDTDSVVLLHKLDDSLVGEELGQMKLEQEIKHGIFIRKKLYALKTTKDKIVIKASGANKNFLLFDNFVELLNGKYVETSRLSFEVNWKSLEVNIVKVSLSLRGIDTQPIRIKDVNETSSTTQYPLVVYSPNRYTLIVWPGKPQPTSYINEIPTGSASLEIVNDSANYTVKEDGIKLLLLLLKFANDKFKSANNYLSTIATRYIENCKVKENIDHCYAQFLDELNYCLGTFDIIDILSIIFARINQHVRLDNLRHTIARDIKLNELNSRDMFKFMVSIRNEIGSFREHVSPNSESRVVDPYFIEWSNLSVFFRIELVDVIEEVNGLKCLFYLKYSAVLNKNTEKEADILNYDRLTYLPFLKINKSRAESNFVATLDNKQKQESHYKSISNNPYYKFFVDFALDIFSRRINVLLKLNKLT